MPPSFLAQTIEKVTGYFLTALLPLFHSFSTWLKMFLKYQSKHAIHSPAQNPSIAVNYTWDKNLNSFPWPSSASQGWLLCCQGADSLCPHLAPLCPHFLHLSPTGLPKLLLPQTLHTCNHCCLGTGETFPQALDGANSYRASTPNFMLTAQSSLI